MEAIGDQLAEYCGSTAVLTRAGSVSSRGSEASDGDPAWVLRAEVNVRLYSREPNETRGVVFLSLDANRLPVVLAARAAGIPYVWSRTAYESSPSEPSQLAGPASSGPNWT